MKKKICSLVFCFILFICISIPAFAEEKKIQITNVDEFVTFAENCRMDSYSKNLVVDLSADLDFSETDFVMIPFFAGVFNGNDHSITGISLTPNGSTTGLFRYLSKEAVLENLHVKGGVQPDGSRKEVAGIVGNNSGKIINCTFVGEISGSDYVGGIVGKNEVTGIIENCQVNGVIHGDHFIGGIAGENLGVIRNSLNYAEINTTAKQNSVSLSDITMDTLTNSESADTVTDIGGIAGLSSGVIRDCLNRGNVGYKHIGYNVGGIAGTQVGYILNCKNYAQIHGRKEVGGIVGQMEPVTYVEYSEDTLQILKGQMNTMSSLTNQAVSNAQGNATAVVNQTNALKGHVDNAKDAVSSLTEEIPDADTIIAAQGTLSSSVNGMKDSVTGIGSATSNLTSSLTKDLNAITGQLNSINETMNSASENLGITIKDVSDEDTEKDLLGKLEKCMNMGSVLGDMNVGGVAGAMAIENDLDILEDWESYGESSLNSESEVRAVILDSENQGEVNARKLNAGGIVGLQSLGLVKKTMNTGCIIAKDCDYVGGISGQSSGFIRNSYSKCEILGNSYIGGIAGSANFLKDCRSMISIKEGFEKIGAILGYANDHAEISSNYYFNIENDYGAIDSISYAKVAEPLSKDKFFELENLPEQFEIVTIHFIYDDGREDTIKVEVGGTISKEQIPEIPKKQGYVGVWDSFEEEDLKNITFDKTYTILYKSYESILESSAVRGNSRPVMLAQGTYSGGEMLELENIKPDLKLKNSNMFVEAWEIHLSEVESTQHLRYQLPEDKEAEQIKLYVSYDGENWTEKASALDGSYLVFSFEGEKQVALVETPNLQVSFAIAFLCIAAVVVVVVIEKRKNK